MTTNNDKEVASEEITLSEVYIEYPGETELKKAIITVGWGYPEPKVEESE